MLIGFDLDLTLVDSAEAVLTSLRHVLDSYGVDHSTSDLHRHIGPPLTDTFADYLPADLVEEACAAYRAHHVDQLHLVHVLPGALEAVAAVREAGGEVVIISGKSTALAAEVAGLTGFGDVHVVGGVFGMDKGTVLLDMGAVAYVGDHPLDMVAAVAAGVVGVGVTTGHANAEELREAGATVILPDLLGFPDWLVQEGTPRFVS